jgi:hypothetical protein
MSKSPHLGGALLGIAKNDTWAGWLKSKVPSGTQATSAGSGSDGLPNDGTGGVDGSAIGTSGGKSNPVHVIVEECKHFHNFRGKIVRLCLRLLQREEPQCFASCASSS